MAHDLFSSETRLLFIQEAESYDLITKIRVFIDEYVLVPLLDYNAGRKKKFLHQHDNGPRATLP